MTGKVAAMALCRLGNQMFIAAAAKTFARRTGRDFIGMVYTHVKRDYPPQQERIMQHVPYIHKEEVADFWLMPHGEYLCNGFPETNEPDVLLNDFFQDTRCIDRDIALDMFRPYDSILKEIAETYGDIGNKVCVNVRRGDYLLVQDQGFRILRKEDIDAILETYFPDDEVLFVSDDMGWCRSNFHGDRYTFADLPCHYKPEMDLYIQTQCKANVISNSTFSWWGAYLNENSERVVCPWPWFSDGKIDPMTHVLPEQWTKWEK